MHDDGQNSPPTVNQVHPSNRSRRELCLIDDCDHQNRCYYYYRRCSCFVKIILMGGGRNGGVERMENLCAHEVLACSISLLQSSQRDYFFE